MAGKLIQVLDVGSRSIKAAQVLVEESRIEIVRKDVAPGPALPPTDPGYAAALTVPLAKIASRVFLSEHPTVVTVSEPLVGMAGMTIGRLTSEAAATKLPPLRDAYARGYAMAGGPTVAFHHVISHMAGEGDGPALVVFGAAERASVGHIVASLSGRGLAVRALFPAGAGLLGLFRWMARRRPKVAFGSVLLADLGHSQVTVLAATGGRPIFLASARLDPDDSREVDALVAQSVVHVEDLARRAFSKVPTAKDDSVTVLVALGGSTAHRSFADVARQRLGVELLGAQTFLVSEGTTFDVGSLGSIAGAALAFTLPDCATLSLSGRTVTEVPIEASSMQEVPGESVAVARLVQVMEVTATSVKAARITIEEGSQEIVRYAIESVATPHAGTIAGLGARTAALGKLAGTVLEPDLPTYVVVSEPLTALVGAPLPDMPAPDALKRLDAMREALARTQRSSGGPVVAYHHLLPYFAGKVDGAGLAMAGAMDQDVLAQIIAPLLDRGLSPRGLLPTGAGLLGLFRLVARAQPRLAFGRILIADVAATSITALAVANGRPIFAGSMPIACEGTTGAAPDRSAVLGALEALVKNSFAGGATDTERSPQTCLLLGEIAQDPALVQAVEGRLGVTVLQADAVLAAPGKSLSAGASLGVMMGAALACSSGEAGPLDVLAHAPEECLSQARRLHARPRATGLPPRSWFVVSVAMAGLLVWFGGYERSCEVRARTEIAMIAQVLAGGRRDLDRLASALRREKLDAERATFAAALVQPHVSWPLIMHLIEQCRPPGVRITRLRCRTALPEPSRMRSSIRIDIVAVATTTDGPRRFVEALAQVDSFTRVGNIVSRHLAGYKPLLEKVTLTLWIR